MIAVLFWPSEKETAHKTSQTNDSKAFRCLYKASGAHWKCQIENWSLWLSVPTRSGHVQCLMFSHMLMLGNHLGFVRTR